MTQTLLPTETRWAAHSTREGVTPFDQASGSIQPVTALSRVAGGTTFGFDFFNEGGTNNLIPGRPTTQTASFQYPAGANNVFVFLTSFLGQFVTNGGNNLTERPLGAFEVGLSFSDSTTLSCTIQLSDSNGDDPVKVSVRGILLFFG